MDPEGLVPIEERSKGPFNKLGISYKKSVFLLNFIQSFLGFHSIKYLFCSSSEIGVVLNEFFSVKSVNTYPSAKIIKLFPSWNGFRKKASGIQVNFRTFSHCLIN